MAIESSMTQEIGGKKALQSDCPSPDSSLTQGDSDMESTSVSSSMQGSISSATSSLDQYSSNVKEETLQKKPLKKLNSRKFASFGSFMSSRRRAQSKLSQSSIKLSDDGSTSTTPLHPSSIEVSDESTNYVQKPMPKFTRTGSLRSVKIFRTNSNNRNKNKTSYKSKMSSTDTFSQASEESHVERATFSSTLKDSKFPEQLKHQSRPSEPEEVLPVAKVCRYQHCSLHGHHHHHEPPTKRFTYLKRRTAKDPKITNTETRPADKSFGKKREPKVSKKVSECKDEVDSSIEFYAKTRSEPLSSYDHDEAEFADMLFGVNSLQERKNEIPVSNNRDFSDLNNEKDDNSNGSKPVLEKKRSVKKKNTISMWGMIHQHMVSGLAAESADSNVQKVDEEPKSETKDFDDAASQETELRKMFAIKLVRDAIEKILLPEVQDDQSTTSEVISEQDVPEKIETPNEQTDESPAPVPEQKPAMKLKKEAPSRWSHLKKVILLTKFVKELEKVKKFKPRKPRLLPVPPETETETVSLRRQTGSGKKNSDDWMLDYALQKVVSELAPTQKRKVALLVKAFETVAPGQDDPPESGCNDEIQRVGSESKDILQETSETNPSADKIEEPKPDLEKEKHLKMWHMIYQHVAVDIATKIGSDLLLDDEESTNGDENNPQEVENQTERNYKLQFTQSDAVKLVRESVDEILLPDTTDTSSQDSQSVASDTASEQEEVVEKKHEDAEPRKLDENKNPTKTTILHHQKSKNWAKLKKLILLKRSIRALEGFRTLKSETPQREKLKTDSEQEKVDLRRQMMDERKKAEQWMLDYAVQHIVTKLTPSRKKRVSMLVEAFEAVVPLPEI
ncbi:putative calcium/calmodulin-dependent protein kinase [Helianthus annuus]|uniref:Calcium/calmodulin-dependent protein kinase n=1 Tax=Helianthus annuus TaxID=4232 RepID=A0A251RNC7_HELAN|nr:calmodulin binding protein PICBP [Helianthus annuus]KAF5772109.1 putative calcium/calmodulin-dependent protein kinase [Helianthus annuus]KAJ0496573.1 putative calcium/calmodulin-dependent protein kinase [Helianthus annuus]